MPSYPLQMSDAYKQCLLKHGIVTTTPRVLLAFRAIQMCFVSSPFYDLVNTCGYLKDIEQLSNHLNSLEKEAEQWYNSLGYIYMLISGHKLIKSTVCPFNVTASIIEHLIDYSPRLKFVDFINKNKLFEKKLLDDNILCNGRDI